LFAFILLPAKLPVEVKFDAVVLPIVDDPEMFRFVPATFPVEVILLTVVEASVELPDTTKF
jgi:hypothetical protein